MSADGQRLVYLQQQNIGNVWIAISDGSSAQQVTFDERGIPEASLSPDGKQIALTMNDVDPLTPSVRLLVQDRDGTNRRQITTGTSLVGSPTWSPDSKRIAFMAASATYHYGDPGRLYVVDAASPGMPESIIDGNWGVWLDAKSLVAYRTNPVSSEEVTLEGRVHRPFFEDSTLAYSMASGKKLFYSDSRAGKQGWWIVSVDHLTGAGMSGRKRLFGPEAFVADLSDRYVYYWSQRGELWRLNVVTESKERLKGPFPGLNPPVNISHRADQKEFLYISYKLSGRLVMIENLFQ